MPACDSAHCVCPRPAGGCPGLRLLCPVPVSLTRVSQYLAATWPAAKETVPGPPAPSLLCRGRDDLTPSDDPKGRPRSKALKAGEVGCEVGPPQLGSASR